MIPCAYCERPLICRDCGKEYLPPTAEHYESLSRRDMPIECPTCEVVLVCRWCQTPYRGLDDADEDDD